ncbi:MAG: glutamyl-tRNA amidotransferase [Oscillospiraceae bacterium]|jgi:hypothetical protein|nr:glutamyl-tRNA amidotransferase [Oscillospiraceae bacterium]
MIAVDARCDSCANCHSELLDGWKPACEAFPDGIPADFYLRIDPAELPECADGIGFEPVEVSVPAAVAVR